MTTTLTFFSNALMDGETQEIELQFTSWVEVATFLANAPLITSFAQFCVELDQALLEQGEASIRMAELQPLAELWNSIRLGFNA